MGVSEMSSTGLQPVSCGQIKTVTKDWGRELWIANTDLYCGKVLIINEGWQCSLHYHKLKDETFYVSQGNVLVELEGREYWLNSGDSVHIPRLAKHRFFGIGSYHNAIFEISTFHSDEDVYRLEPSKYNPGRVIRVEPYRG
jgi:mannose-6-phosphate isomerase-like protein (cupin superfamily)